MFFLLFVLSHANRHRKSEWKGFLASNFEAKERKKFLIHVWAKHCIFLTNLDPWTEDIFVSNLWSAKKYCSTSKFCSCIHEDVVDDAIHFPLAFFLPGYHLICFLSMSATQGPFKAFETHRRMKWLFSNIPLTVIGCFVYMFWNFKFHHSLMNFFPLSPRFRRRGHSFVYDCYDSTSFSR